MNREMLAKASERRLDLTGYTLLGIEAERGSSIAKWGVVRSSTSPF